MKTLSRSRRFAPATLATVALAAGGVGNLSAIDFRAPYEVNPPANGGYSETNDGSVGFGAWTATLDDNSGGGSRYLDTTLAPASVFMSFRSVPFNFTVDSFTFSAVVPLSAAAGFVSFDYEYHDDTDSFGTTGFSYEVNNGAPVLITGNTASGPYSFAVNPGDSFGFVLSGSYYTNVNVRISNFSAPVPEPSSLVLLATGFAGLLGMRRIRSNAQNN